MRSADDNARAACGVSIEVERGAVVEVGGTCGMAWATGAARGMATVTEVSTIEEG
jgi:hypothetical protein